MLGILRLSIKTGFWSHFILFSSIGWIFYTLEMRFILSLRFYTSVRSWFAERRGYAEAGIIGRLFDPLFRRARSGVRWCVVRWYRGALVRGIR